MARGLSNSCSSDGDDHFISLMRLFNENKEYLHDRAISFPQWIEKYCDYSHTKHTQAGVHDLSDPNLEVQRKMGVLINKVWTVEMKDPIHLAQYCAFKSIRELSSYIDVIVPDIVYQAAFVAQNYFLKTMREASQADRDFQNLIEPLNTRFRDFQRQDRYEHRMIDIDGMAPIKFLSTFHGDEKIRRLINDVAKLCMKPTFIPVLNQTVSTPGEPGEISPCAFILAHAVQILLFAPQDWNPNRVYSRDQSAYPHRFPTPEAIGGGTTRTVAGLFSVEDLHRAVLLFSHLLKRRSASKWITKTAPQSSSNAEFPGYHCPAPAAMNQDQSEVATAPLLHGEPDNSMANHQADQRVPLEGLDAPEALDEPLPIKGFDTIKINTMLIESATTTRPRRTVTERRRELRKPEMHPLLGWELKAEVASAKNLHAQPDFDKLLARSRETETRVTFSFQGLDIAALMRQQVASRPGAGDIPPTIIIEECDFHDRNPIACLVSKLKPKVSEQLCNQTDEGMLEHRKALLACFDWRNNSVLKSSTAFFPGTLGNAKSVIERLNDPNVPRSQIEDDTNPDVTTMVNFVLVGLFVTAGFDVGTVRTSDGTVETDRIIREWNSPQSGLDIFVANVNTKVMHADMQKCCCKALILDWPLEPERLLRTINHMVKNRLNHREPATVHILKLRWSHHDEVERICCTKWAMQLSKDINLPEWMTGAVREVCIFEMIKTAWHQGFNRYTWVVMHDMGGQDYDGRSMTHHDGIAPRLGHVFSIAAKLMLNFPEDKKFWADSKDALVAGCHHFLKVIDADFEKGTDRLEEKLSYTPERLRENCFLAFEHSMWFTHHQFEQEYGHEDAHYERNEQLRLGVEARARGDVSSWPGDVESQVEEQDAGVDADTDGDEEIEQSDEAGTKRRAGDDGEGGAKKQKTSTT
ncbi:hypothetical protein H9Q72_005469 [Fusarium xylarioides]|uniref:Uncharacterized protein n=1 Tax=Fusarium xylarioides TaxID=221167 RepID=A0A9P7HZJ6_9HYPO|nr:hypothetical protein H9Q72_005469 [Fusarium xylarioides]